jgi:TolB-like protein/Flp pilus assembly protein TadD
MRSHVQGRREEIDETLQALGGAPSSREGLDADTSGSLEFDSSRDVLGGRYAILGLLGSGGAGRVYRARDLELDEVVALKMLHRSLTEDPGALDRFRREVKLARRVTHRNVARVFDIGEHGSEKFLTMEFVDGEPLSAVIARESALGLARAIEIAQSVCAGLSSAHAAGVIHCDLKPDNVLLAKDGRVVVTDFGIALALAAVDAAPDAMGLVLGTPAYMAPEQVEGRTDADARADIYAFGALLYELFTGVHAWQGRDPMMVASARLSLPPPDPRLKRADIPGACAELVLKCMARRREDRPASIDQVVAALDALALSASVVARGGVRRSRPPADATVHQARLDNKTVAVLPFRNAGAAEDDYLAEEVTDDLIDALSMTRGLKVRARLAVQRFRGSGQDARAIGRELDVQVVVDGSVRRARGTLRITARLISVDDGFQLWAKRFDRPEQDLLSINDEAAKAISEALTVDREAGPREAPTDPAALDLYLRARHAYRKFWPDHLRRAIDLFENASLLAPNDPMILSGEAMALARLSYFVGDTGIARTREVARRAVALAPNFAEARLALAGVLFQSGEPKLAIGELRRAVTLNPGFAEAQAALGRLLVETGRIEEGMRRLEAAIALDPGVPLGCGTLALANALLNRWDLALSIVDKQRETEGEMSFWTTSARLVSWSRSQELAEAYLSELAGRPDYGTSRALIEVAARLELTPEAASLLAIGRSPEGSVRRRQLYLQLEAEVMSMLGDVDRVIGALQRVAAIGLTDFFWLERCPLFDFVRDDPRFGPIHDAVSGRAREILEAYASS